MAKGGGKKKKARRAETGASESAGDKKARPSKVAKAVAGAKATAGKIGDNPLVAEVVAAALVATAAALRNPKNARKMASSAAGELEETMKEGGQKAGAFWQLALDIARRSIAAIEAESGVGAKAAGSKKKVR